jgi:hypothetical protein
LYIGRTEKIYSNLIFDAFYNVSRPYVATSNQVTSDTLTCVNVSCS